MTKVISTGDFRTFDPALNAFFTQNNALITGYHERDAILEADRRAGGMRYILERNPVGAAYLQFKEQLAELFKLRTVRCWHYTRLTKEEIDAIRTVGISPGTIESMEARVARQVQAGRLSADEQAAIIAASPLRRADQARHRRGFWVVDRALHPSDGGVQPLLGHWGGEVVYFNLQDDALLARLQQIGTPVVLELAVPVSSTEQALGFAESALSTVVKQLGYPPQLRAIDACVIRPLGKDCLMDLIVASDPRFQQLGSI